MFTLKHLFVVSFFIMTSHAFHCFSQDELELANRLSSLSWTENEIGESEWVFQCFEVKDGVRNVVGEVFFASRPNTRLIVQRFRSGETIPVSGVCLDINGTKFYKRQWVNLTMVESDEPAISTGFLQPLQLGCCCFYELFFDGLCNQLSTAIEDQRPIVECILQGNDDQLRFQLASIPTETKVDYLICRSSQNAKVTKIEKTWNDGTFQKCRSVWDDARSCPYPSEIQFEEVDRNGNSRSWLIFVQRVNADVDSLMARNYWSEITSEHLFDFFETNQLFERLPRQKRIIQTIE